MTWDTRSRREEGFVLKTERDTYLFFSIDNAGPYPRGFHEVPLSEATIFPGPNPGVTRHWEGVGGLESVKVVRSVNSITTTHPEGATAPKNHDNRPVHSPFNHP